MEDFVERTNSRKSKVVIEREGRGKNSSTHSVNILGTKILSRWGGMTHIESLYYFSYISMLLEWKNLEVSPLKRHGKIVSYQQMYYFGVVVSSIVLFHCYSLQYLCFQLF